MNRRTLLALSSALIVSLLLVSCGGGGGGGSVSTTPSTGSSAAILFITNTRLPEVLVGQSYSATLQASGGIPPYAWSTKATLPSGLSLDPKTGIISGTAPNSSGIVSIAFTVADSANPPQSFTKLLDIWVNGAITLDIHPQVGVRNIPYSCTGYLSGGHPTYTVTIDSGVPPGLQLKPQSTDRYRINEVTLEGTPTEAGEFVAKLRVKDSAAPSQEVLLPVNLSISNTLIITTSKLREGVVGRAYSDTIAEVNGVAPLHWSATSLPNGLTLNADTGQVSGTPTINGWVQLSVHLTDSSTPPRSVSSGVALIIDPVLAFIAPTSLEVNRDSSFSQELYQGGLPPTTVSIVSGSLPPGINFWGAYLSGRPTATGVYTPTIRVQDSDTPAVSIEGTFTITVLPPLPIPAAMALPNGAVGKSYAAQLYARVGTLPYHWSVTSGNFPPGLAMDVSGAITGAPTTAGNYSFTATVTDSATPPQSAGQQYSIKISTVPLGRNDSIATATPFNSWASDASLSPFADPPDSTTSAPDTDYYRVVSLAGSKITVRVPSTATIDPAIEILDANGQRFKTCRDVSDDNPTLPYIVRDATPDAFDDECLNDDIDPGVNQTASLEFLVPGPASTGATFYIHVFESRGDARPDMTYGMSVSGIQQPLGIGTGVPNATMGRQYGYWLNATGSYNLPLLWSLAPGSRPLPPGLTISSGAGGQITGTPTAAGSYDFTLQVTDSSNPPQVATGSFNMTVYDGILILTDRLPDYKVGQPYSYVVPTSGGVPPLYWSFYSANWCCLQLNQTTGEWTQLSAGPFLTGTFTADVFVRDAVGKNTYKPLMLISVP